MGKEDRTWQRILTPKSGSFRRASGPAAAELGSFRRGSRSGPRPLGSFRRQKRPDPQPSGSFGQASSPGTPIRGIGFVRFRARSRIGFVRIGRPRSRLASSGSARFDLSDSSWKRRTQVHEPGIARKRRSQSAREPPGKDEAHVRRPVQVNCVMWGNYGLASDERFRSGRPKH